MLRSVPMPADTNSNGDIFGGWLLSQMDIAGGLAAKETSRGRTATVAIDAMTFHKPVFVGDIVCCYADVKRIGNSSVTVLVQAWVIRSGYGGERIKVTEGKLTYVAIDDNGSPRTIQPHDNT